MIVIDLSVGEDPKQLIKLVNPEFVEREGEQRARGRLPVRARATAARRCGPRASSVKGLDPDGKERDLHGHRAAGPRLLPRDRPHRRPAVRGPADPAEARPHEAQAAQEGARRRLGRVSARARSSSWAAAPSPSPRCRRSLDAGHEVAARGHPARPREGARPRARAPAGEAGGASARGLPVLQPRAHQRAGGAGGAARAARPSCRWSSPTARSCPRA